MASRIVKLPDIGEGVAEAEVVDWHVKVGDLIREDQPLVDVMTDKATVEIPSPVAGTVMALGGERGQMLAVGSELVRLDVGGGGAGAPSNDSKPQPGIEAPPDVEAAENAEAGKSSGELEPGADGLAPAQPSASRHSGAEPTGPASSRPDDRLRSEPGSHDRASQVVGSGFSPAASPGMTAKGAPKTRSPLVAPVPLGPPRPAGEKPIASPAVRGRALEAGIDLRQVRGTGPAGRIGHDDLDAFLRAGAEPETPATPARRAANTAVEEIKVTGLRRRIAQKMAESKRRVAHFSYVEEVDVTALEELRAALNTRFGTTRSKLTLIPFLVAALVRALPDFPQINALYDDEADVIRRHGGIHVGIATQTAAGLMVPVVRHAEARDLWDCATEVRRLAEAARNGLAARDELTGSTITITSLGALGGIVTTPVVNRPEVAILGVNKQVMRPVWRDAAFVPRLTMNLSASFDHRVVDGYDAALFVQALKGLLETPALLLLDS